MANKKNYSTEGLNNRQEVQCRVMMMVGLV